MGNMILAEMGKKPMAGIVNIYDALLNRLGVGLIPAAAYMYIKY